MQREREAIGYVTDTRKLPYRKRMEMVMTEKDQGIPDFLIDSSRL